MRNVRVGHTTPLHLTRYSSKSERRLSTLPDWRRWHVKSQPVYILSQTFLLRGRGAGVFERPIGQRREQGSGHGSGRICWSRHSSCC